MGMGWGERASARRLERGRDDRSRRERRREAERAVGVVVLVPRRHSVAVDLAVEPALSEDRGEDAAYPRLGSG